jgi:hypothetical protein
MKRFNLILVCLWGAFLAQVVFKSFVGWEVPRQLLVLQGIFEAIFILGGFYLLVLRKLLGRNEFRIYKKHTVPLFIMIFVWTGLLAISFILGMFEDYSTGYIIGDFFNYFKLPLLLMLSYFAIRDISDIELYIKGVILLFGVFLVFDLVRNSAFVAAGTRISTFTLVNCGFMIVVQLFFLLHTRSAVWKVICYIMLGITFLGMIISQSRTSVVVVGLGIVFIPFLGQVKLSRGFRRGMGVAFVGVLLLFLLAPVAVRHMHGFYKRFALLGMTAEGRGVMGMGQRLPQTIGIFTAFSKQPENLALGFGLGSSLKTRMKIKKMVFSSNEHNPHAGILLILFRLGIAGFSLSLFYAFYFFRKGMIYRRMSWTGGLLAMVLIIEILSGGVLYSNSLIHTLCGGFLAAEKAMAGKI